MKPPAPVTRMRLPPRSSDNGSSNPNTLTNAIIFNGGTLLSQGALVDYNGPITVLPSTTSLLSPTGGVDIILGGSITGSGTLDKNAGNMSMRLAGDNSGFTGTYIHSGLGATIFYSPDAGSAA